LTCPACRKCNETNDDVCARCGCDLTALRAIAAIAARFVSLAAASLRQGQPGDALRFAERSWRLRRTPEAARVAFLASAANGQMAAALHWQKRAGD
jgi:hypothetical protein